FFSLTTLTPTTLFTLSLHDALPISTQLLVFTAPMVVFEPLYALIMVVLNLCWAAIWILPRWRNVHFETSAEFNVPAERLFEFRRDRKSTRLNSSHRTISYAVFCLKK